MDRDLCHGDKDSTPKIVRFLLHKGTTSVDNVKAGCTGALKGVQPQGHNSGTLVYRALVRVSTHRLIMTTRG